MKSPRIAAWIAWMMLTAAPAHAARPGSYDSWIDYIVSFPTAGTGDFVNDVSWRGFGVGGVRRVSENWGAGLTFRWIYFSETRENETYTSGSVVITGTQFRSVDSLPIYFVGRRYFESGNLEGYLGLGFGAMYGQRQLQIGTYAFDYYGWQFGVAPELGVKIPFSETAGLDFNVKYDAGFGSDAIPATSFWSVNFGVAFTH